MSAPLLSIRNLRAWYAYGKNVLIDLSLELAEQEIVGLIGLNGAGKTTFVNVLSGLHPDFQSDGIRFQGQPADVRKKDFKTCRYTVFDEDHSFAYFTFWEYLSYVFLAYGREVPDVSGLIEGFHFAGYTDVLLKDLSTGNRKKAFLITAFALKLPLLLLDEPVNGLDVQSTEYLYRQIQRYKEYGTILFSSHILESITLTSDRVLVLEDGQIQRSFEGGSICAADIREVLHDEEDK